MGSVRAPMQAVKRGGRPPRVDLADLNRMLARACPGHRAVSAQLLRGGLANRSFKVWLSDVDEPVVVRVYVRDPSAAAREASILDRVKERVPVPEVIYCRLKV